MSGHSHWAGIKHKKQVTDAQKSKVFSKLVREIVIASKSGGDPISNPKLRVAIERAKKVNMSKDNIEKAVKKGMGELGGEKFEEFLFEAYGPGGITILIEGITDNKNRALVEIKGVLNQYNGKLVGEGGVKWMYERKGCLSLDLASQNEDLKDKEKLELLVIESGVDDISWDDNILNIYTGPENLEEIKKSLEEKGLKIENASVGWAAKEEMVLPEKEKEQAEKLFENLDELDSVQEIYFNLKI